MNTSRPLRRTGKAATVTWLAAVALLLGVGLLAVAGYAWWSSYTYVPPKGGDASLAGLGYVIAGVLAVPAVLGLLLTGIGFALRSRRPTAALVAATLGLTLVLFPVMLASMVWSGSR